MHETTQLCIRQIKKYVTDTTRILDVGCGSGILGMLALKFGADYSVGTDLDPCAIDATHENMKENGVSKDRYEVMIEISSMIKKFRTVSDMKNTILLRQIFLRMSLSP